MAESVRIERSGAERILNSKSMYSRSRIPRLVVVDQVEDDNLGDKECSMDNLDDDVFEVGDVIEH